VKEPLGTPYLDVGGQESQQNQLLQNSTSKPITTQ
jgi:hypothetical protein